MNILPIPCCAFKRHLLRALDYCSSLPRGALWSSGLMVKELCYSTCVTVWHLPHWNHLFNSVYWAQKEKGHDIITWLPIERWGRGFESPPGQKFVSDFCSTSAPSAVNPCCNNHALLMVRWGIQGEDRPPTLICCGQEIEVACTSNSWLPQG